MTSSSGKQGSNWKMGFSSTVEERNYRPYNEQQMGMEKGPKSLGIPNSQNELRHGTTPKPGKCENKVISRKNCISNFFCCYQSCNCRIGKLYKNTNINQFK